MPCSKIGLLIMKPVPVLSFEYIDPFYLDPELPFRYTEQDFQTALSAVGFGVRKQPSVGIPEPIAHQVRRVLGRAGRNVRVGKGSKLLCLMMGPLAYRLVPDGILNRCALYCFDTWPDNFAVWDSLFKRFKTEVAFFTSRNARDRFERLFPAMHCYWVPEGSNPELHRPQKMLVSRSIDVLEFGRRYDRYHNAIVTQLNKAGKNHLYEVHPGQVVFRGREALLRGLAESRIVVCFPSSVTHPSRAEIETITVRYMEAMASGCLVVGHCPADLRELFGYNPVVDADAVRPGDHLLEILDNIGEWQPLIRRNIEKVFENTWIHRARDIKRILEAENGITAGL
jgi:hypothetical protein